MGFTENPCSSEDTYPKKVESTRTNFSTVEDNLNVYVLLFVIFVLRAQKNVIKFLTFNA